jgi:phage terminase large subunit-like protein
LDEAHEQKDSKLWDVLCSSQGMRDNPLACIITTAGFNKHGFCYGYRETCIEILSGVKENPSQFAAIYTLDEDDDWTDPDVWIKANPSLGVTVRREYLEQQVQNAKNNPSLEVGIKTKNFNIWCDSAETWLTADLILEYTQKIDIANFKGAIGYLGVDLASVGDLTAVSCLIPDYSGKHYFKTYYYLPQDSIEGHANSELYKKWKRLGLLTVTPGNVTDYDYITADIQRIAKDLSISCIGYDSWNATSWAIQATSLGLPLEPYSQSLGNFNKPTKEFERLLKSGKIILDDSEITRYCFKNVALKYDHNENCKPVKGDGSLQKIDGVIAILTALGSYLESPMYNQEIYVM